jgi:hypothetical protein
MGIHDAGMRGEDVARRAPGPHLLLDGGQGFLGRGVHGRMVLRGLADHQRPHEGGVVMAVDARPLKRELIALDELAAARLVAAEQRVRPEPMMNSLAG